MIPIIVIGPLTVRLDGDRGSTTLDLDAYVTSPGRGGQQANYRSGRWYTTTCWEKSRRKIFLLLTSNHLPEVGLNTAVHPRSRPDPDLPLLHPVALRETQDRQAMMMQAMISILTHQVDDVLKKLAFLTRQLPHP